MVLPISAGFASFRPFAVLRVTGEDALAFLQGQFTQELRSPSKQICAYGLWLNQKGKVLADSYALRDDEGWWLISIHSSAALIKERLEAYIIADDVVLEDQTEAWEARTIFGPGSSEVFAKVGVAAPRPEEWVRAEEGLLFRGRRGSGEAWEWLKPRSSAHWMGFDGIPQVSADTLERERILTGIPSVPKDVGPGDLPNEAGLEDIAISYSKGCYLGQEVMARLKSMGQIRRKLLRVQGPGLPPETPAPLFASGKKVGELRSAVVVDAAQGFVGLAMLSLIGLDFDRLLSLEPEGPATTRILPNAP